MCLANAILRLCLPEDVISPHREFTFLKCVDHLFFSDQSQSDLNLRWFDMLLRISVYMYIMPHTLETNSTAWLFNLYFETNVHLLFYRINNAPLLLCKKWLRGTFPFSLRQVQCTRISPPSDRCKLLHFVTYETKRNSAFGGQCMRPYHTIATPNSMATLRQTQRPTKAGDACVLRL